MTEEKKWVFVLGAGVDVPLGLPVANGFLSELSMFAKGEGKAVDTALREKFPRFRFSFDKFGGEQGEGFAEHLLTNRSELIPLLKKALSTDASQDSEPLKALSTLLDRLGDIDKANHLDDTVLAELAKIGEQSYTASGGDSLLSPRGLNLTHIPRAALRRVYHGATRNISLTEEEREILSDFVIQMSTFEELLGEFFTGFFTRNSVQKKRYVYTSWLLWAYLKTHMARAHLAADSFYSTLSVLEDCNAIITFNYTNFFPQAVADKVCYFHGECSTYLLFEDREIIRDEAVSAVTDANSAAQFIKNLKLDLDGGRTYLPSIIPPLPLKPVLSSEYLETWHSCKEALNRAEAIIIIGYSFNLIDEHFNDLLRKGNQNSRIIVINPDMGTVVGNMMKLKGLTEDQLTEVQRCGLSCRQGRRILFVPALSQQVTAEMLRELASYDEVF